jgi:hypothetical protein
LLFRYIAVSRSAEDAVIVESDARAASRPDLFKSAPHQKINNAIEALGLQFFRFKKKRTS